MWEGLANAELRGEVLRIMPKGEEQRGMGRCSDHCRAWLRLDSADTGAPPQPYERLTTRNQ